MSSSFSATIANEPIGPYRIYRIEDSEQKPPLLLFEVSYLDERFGIDVTNAAGQPIRLVLTEKPNPEVSAVLTVADCECGWNACFPTVQSAPDKCPRCGKCSND